MPGALFCSHCGQRIAASVPAAGSAPTVDQAPAVNQTLAAGSAPAADQAPAVDQALEADQTLAAGQTPAAGQAPAADQAAAAGSAPAPAVMQTLVGNNNVQIYLNKVEGSEVNINVEAPRKPQPLSLPVFARMEPFPTLLDRQPELQEATRALEMHAPVEISGEMGLGKSSLLRTISNSPEAEVTRFPGGVVYRRAFNQAVPDLLQSIFSLFNELPENYKPSPEEIQRSLQNLAALVILDDIGLTRDELTDLRSQAPHCTFVTASVERSLWGEGHALALQGLPAEDAVTLVERGLGRPLTEQERSAARQLSETLKGNPDRLLKTAAIVHAGQTFEAVLKSLAQAPITPILVAGLPDPELRVLSVVALGRGAAVPLEHIAPLAGLADARPPLKTLQQQHLVQANSPSYTLTGALAQELWRDWDLTSWGERAVDYFIHWAEAQSGDPRRILPSADMILQLLGWAVSRKQWAQVLRLGRAIQVALALGLRWAAWLQVLNWCLMAARALGEKALEGWALHQIGTHAMCVGNREAGRTFLTQALQLRHAIGDRAGAAVTQHNLNLLLGPLALPSHGEPPSGQPPSTSNAAGALSAGGISKWILPLIGATVLVVAAVVIGIWHPWSGGTSKPASTATRFIRSPIPPRTVTPTDTPPPDIQFFLEGGCDNPLPPSTGQIYFYTANLDGWATVKLDGEVLPGANREPVSAGGNYSGKLQTPRQPGDHVLTLDFDTGTTVIERICRFSVARLPTLTPTPPPVVNLWLDPGKCGGQFAPGDPIGIHVNANQDGQVDFSIQSGLATSREWYPIGNVSSLDVKADQEAKLGWLAPDAKGSYTLRARLNGGQAEAICDLQVIERNPPTLQGITLVPRLPCADQTVDAYVDVRDDTGIDAVEVYYRNPGTETYLLAPGNKIDDYTYQFTFAASRDYGTSFYVNVRDVYGNLLSTQELPNQAWSGFTETGIDYEQYCVAYLILPATDLPTMDLPEMPYSVDTWQACKDQCNGNLSCQSFTFAANTSSCWLKNGVPTAMPNEVCISGIKFTVPIP